MSSLESGSKNLVFFNKNDNIETPTYLKSFIYAKFNITHDPCPLNYTVDGLTTDWGTCNFVNPPFSKIGAWLKKGFSEWTQFKRKSVFLITVRTSSKYWRIHVANKVDHIIFFDKGLAFKGFDKPLPVSLCLAFYGINPYTKLWPDSRLVTFVHNNKTILTGYNLEASLNDTLTNNVEIIEI